MIIPTATAISPFAAKTREVPVYTEHVGRDEATFDAIRRELSLDDQKTRDLVRTEAARIDHNNERIAKLETQMQELHNWKDSVTRGLWEVTLLVLGSLLTLFFAAWKIQKSYVLISEGYQKINANHKLLNEQFAEWDGKERRKDDS